MFETGDGSEVVCVGFERVFLMLLPRIVYSLTYTIYVLERPRNVAVLQFFLYFAEKVRLILFDNNLRFFIVLCCHGSLVPQWHQPRTSPRAPPVRVIGDDEFCGEQNVHILDWEYGDMPLLDSVLQELFYKAPLQFDAWEFRVPKLSVAHLRLELEVGRF